jgi:hypothetical protein
MTTRKKTRNKAEGKGKSLSLSKRTLKDLSIPGAGPNGGVGKLWTPRMPTITCPQH